MRRQHIAMLGLIGLLAVLALGCARMTADEEAEMRQAFGIPAGMPMKDLGVIEFRAGLPKRVHLGAGKDCTITATVLTNGLVQLNLVYESQSEVSDGVKTQAHTERSQLVFRAGSLWFPRAGRPGWLCLPGTGQHLAVALQPKIIWPSEPGAN
jgi:hypothetical protein